MAWQGVSPIIHPPAAPVPDPLDASPAEINTPLLRNILNRVVNTGKVISTMRMGLCGGEHFSEKELITGSMDGVFSKLLMVNPRKPSSGMDSLIMINHDLSLSIK